MAELKLIGGARIGMANATWPLATLKVSHNKLALNAACGSVVFLPEDVISVEAYTAFPSLANGIRIKHRVPRYKSKVVFWTFKDTSEVLRQIKDTGFLENIDSTITEKDVEIFKQQEGNFPIKTSVVVGVLVLFYLLLAYDFIYSSISNEHSVFFGNGMAIAFSLLFLASILTLTSNKFRKLILKEGKSIKTARLLLLFLMYMSVFMLIGNFLSRYL